MDTIKDLWQSTISNFNSEPKGLRDANINYSIDKSDEIKEIVHLTNMMHEVEKSVNNFYLQFDIIRLRKGNIETGESRDVKLLRDMQYLQELMASDRQVIKDLKQKIAQYKSSDKQVAKIKKSFMLILSEKEQLIESLNGKIAVMESELEKRNETIVQQATVINTKNEVIESQTQQLAKLTDVIENLQQNHLILYSKKETKHLMIEGDAIQLDFKKKHINIISEHPLSSYSIVNDGDFTTVKITDSSSFWGSNNYLLVRVDKNKL